MKEGLYFGDGEKVKDFANKASVIVVWVQEPGSYFEVVDVSQGAFDD